MYIIRIHESVCIAAAISVNNKSERLRRFTHCQALYLLFFYYQDDAWGYVRVFLRTRPLRYIVTRDSYLMYAVVRAHQSSMLRYGWYTYIRVRVRYGHV